MDSWSAVLGIHCMNDLAVYYSNGCDYVESWRCRTSFGRTAGGGGPYICGRTALVLFVLIGFIHGEAAEFIGDFEQVLVALVPFRADLAQKHGTLVGPAQLQVADFADVGPQPSRIFHVIAIGELRIGETLNHFIEFFALQRPRMHGEKWSSCGFGQFNEILPAVGIVAHFPHDALDLLVVHVAVKTAHTVALDEGNHVVFYGT